MDNLQDDRAANHEKSDEENKDKIVDMLCMLFSSEGSFFLFLGR